MTNNVFHDTSSIIPVYKVGHHTKTFSKGFLNTKRTSDFVFCSVLDRLQPPREFTPGSPSHPLSVPPSLLVFVVLNTY